STIRPTTVAGFPEGSGMGRIVRFSSPQPLIDIIDRIGLGLGNPKGFPIAIPQGKRMDEMRISSVGICAGSGGDLLRNLDVDLLFTGELSHHEALAAIEKGQCVICLFHSNTERGFLHSVLKQQLKNTIGKEWEKVRREERAKEGLSDDYLEALEDEHTEVQVSEVDRDPYGVMIISKYLFGDTSKESIIELPQGQLYIVRPLSPKGYSELIFKDAAASIRRAGKEFQYQLVIQRAYEEGEAELLDEEGGESEAIGGLGGDNDEKTFLLDESLHFRTEIREGGETVFAWKDLSGDPGDLY
ncbi:hypothetical protein LTR28_012243, partial [Elasticomyces elasticus]